MSEWDAGWWRAAILLTGLLAGILVPQRARAQMVTDERVHDPGWWPTKGAYLRADYVGPQACAECHPAQAEAQKTTAMALAGGPSQDSNILRRHDLLTVTLGDFTYTITREGERSIYTVSGGSETFSQPLQWAMGLGVLGQTFVYERQGSFYEGRVSFFSSVDRLDLTPGQHTTRVKSLADARGRLLSEAEAKECFACHTTAAVAENRLDPSQLIPGVTCEACHGPGARHLAAVKSGANAKGTIFNPATLAPGDSMDFCGACHRTWSDVRQMNVRSQNNVRFQPYRLLESRCWSPDDARIQCMACHDPHQPLISEPSSYDEKCLACHATSKGTPLARGKKARACPVEGRNCVSCHMPKVEPAGLHFSFTDHRIRIARPGQPYPN